MFAPITSLILVSILVALGVLHLLWALGSSFPCANEQELARAVVGRRGITKMPSSLSCAGVAFCLFAAAALAGLLGGHVFATELLFLHKAALALAGLAAALVFLGRGIIGVLPAFERSAPELPFLSLNRRVYSPLSFLIGLGFLLLVISLPNWSWRFGGG
ncbi:DUF3995 domain-containing protein [Hyphomonas atlantica]|mgnify:FL=1|uniref:DUF3995 domain-containing protein n=1 Tax=Hyphomonas atlantica TaxID=1280948 RepID=UPI0032B1449F